MSKMPKQQPGLSKQDYSTPEVFLDATKKLLGIDEFSWDLAADKDNTVCANDSFFDESNSAFNYDWHYFGSGGWLYLNPPFSNIEPWVAKCNSEAQAGAKIAMLVPASTGSLWFGKYVHEKARVLFLSPRLNFMPDKPGWAYPKDLILCLYGPCMSGYQWWRWK